MAANRSLRLFIDLIIILLFIFVCLLGNHPIKPSPVPCGSDMDCCEKNPDICKELNGRPY
jgi:hypothetical protein